MKVLDNFRDREFLSVRPFVYDMLRYYEGQNLDAVPQVLLVLVFNQNLSLNLVIRVIKDVIKYQCVLLR